MLLDVVKMWHRFIFLLALILSASSIKVPVDNVEPTVVAQEDTKSTPIYYIKDDANIDSYLVPPDPHITEEVVRDDLGTLATYLLPPAKEHVSDFYIASEPSAQSDWLPILQAQNNRNPRYQLPPLESMPILFNPNRPQGVQVPVPLPVPSTQLVPPAVDAVNEYFIPIPDDEETDQPADRPAQAEIPNNHWPTLDDDRSDPTVYPQLEPAESPIALHLTPPKPYKGIKLPTKLFPKKYSSEFKPVPIPLTQVDEKEPQPKAKPVKYFKPEPSAEVEHYVPADKRKPHYFKKEHKRKQKGEDDTVKHLGDVEAETYGVPTSAEQETSETNFRYPGRPSHPAPSRHVPPTVPPRDNSLVVAPAPDGRTEFRMHGMKGPHSYQFGYDTGKGKNRQFRYEERDNEGIVRGHYGYVDKLGKLRVVNYSAHPEYGFRAEEPVEKE